jgi:hypothetical protein
MTAQEFTTQMLELLRRRPFVPFDVELVTGERFTIDREDVTSCDGGSAIFGEKDDGPIHLFDYVDTKKIHRPAETRSA